jgi:hypothetical protein
MRADAERKTLKRFVEPSSWPAGGLKVGRHDVQKWIWLGRQTFLDRVWHGS